MLAYFMTIWYILLPIGKFYGHLVHFVVIWYISPFWYFVPRKIWQPWLRNGRSVSGKTQAT
jgi:hypothetical protein